MRGYEYQKGKYVTISAEEFDNLKSEDEKTIEIVGFVNIEEIDPVYYEKSYVVNSPQKSKAYSLFKEALASTRKVALAKTVIGTKFYYVILRFNENMIIMNTLYFEEEIVIPEMVADSKFTKQELALAVKLIKSLEMKFKPQELIDEYHEKLERAIDLKVDGKEIKKPKSKPEKSIKDLMTALEMSLKNV